MRPRLQRAPLPKLLAHAAHRSHTKTENLGNFASALASLVELQNALADGDRDGRHSPTLAHNYFPGKLHHLWKCSSQILRCEVIVPNENSVWRTDGSSLRTVRWAVKKRDQRI